MPAAADLVAAALVCFGAGVSRRDNTSKPDEFLKGHGPYPAELYALTDKRLLAALIRTHT
jgi:hypothetical protein